MRENVQEEETVDRQATMNGVRKQSVVRADREQQRLHDNGLWFFHRRHRFSSSTENYSVVPPIGGSARSLAAIPMHSLNTAAASFLLLLFSCVCKRDFRYCGLCRESFSQMASESKLKCRRWEGAIVVVRS